MKNKKTLEYYMSLPYSFELTPDPDDGGYVVSFPDLRGCLTVGETVQEAYENAMDAKLEWLSVALEYGIEIPEPSAIKEDKTNFKLQLPKSLQRVLTENSKKEGISLNQYCLYLLTKNSLNPAN